MTNETIIDAGIKYVRINKTVAKRLYKECKCVYVFGHKQRRDFDYVSRAWPVFDDDYTNFDKWLNAWSFYNEHIFGRPIFFAMESDVK